MAVIIPARNEAAHIGGAVRSIEQQDYSGRLGVFLVEPPGWAGKMWAVHQGIVQASRRNPDFFLLTDADIVHGPDTARSLIARAEEKSLDLVSYMLLLRTRTMAERLMMPGRLARDLANGFHAVELLAVAARGNCGGHAGHLRGTRRARSRRMAADVRAVRLDAALLFVAARIRSGIAWDRAVLHGRDHRLSGSALLRSGRDVERGVHSPAR